MDPTGKKLIRLSCWRRCRCAVWNEGQPTLCSQFFVSLNNVDMALAQSRKLYEEMKEDIAGQLKIIEVLLL